MHVCLVFGLELLQLSLCQGPGCLVPHYGLGFEEFWGRVGVVPFYFAVGVGLDASRVHGIRCS